MSALSLARPPRAENMDLAGELGRCESCGDPLPAGRQSECEACLRWGAPCERCGERGQMKHGDPDDCRSADCTAAKIDAAMDRDRDDCRSADCTAAKIDAAMDRDR